MAPASTKREHTHAGPPPSLEALAASAVAAWRARGSPWLQVRVQAALGLALSAQEPRRLRAEILAALRRLESCCVRQGRLASATLGCWPAPQSVRLELWADGHCVRFWSFPRQPLAGAVPRTRRGRLALPAHRDWPHARVHAATTACLVGRSPFLLELARSRISRFGLGGVWQTSSVRQALQWLAAHPRCWLLLVESDRGVWCCDPSSRQMEATAALLPYPLSADVLDPCLRRFFHHRVEMRHPLPGSSVRAA